MFKGKKCYYYLKINLFLDFPLKVTLLDFKILRFLGSFLSYTNNFKYLPYQLLMEKLDLKNKNSISRSLTRLKNLNIIEKKIIYKKNKKYVIVKFKKPFYFLIFRYSKKFILSKNKKWITEKGGI